MNGSYVSRRELKGQAKRTLRQFMRPCIMVSAAVLLFSLITYLVRGYTGGLVFPGMLDPALYPIQTGLWGVSPELMTTLGLGEFSARGGILAALRVEAAGAVMVYVLPWVQLVPFFITMALVFLVSTPIQYGGLNQLWNVVEGRPVSPKGLFAFYLDLRLTGKALALQFVLSLWEWLAQLVCMAPAMALMMFSAQADGGSPVWYAVMALMLVGLVVGYYLSLRFVPVRLIMARSPGLSIPDAFRQGAAAFRGRRKEFFSLWLSFLPWHFVSMFTYNLVDLFVFPYQQIAGMLFLTAGEAGEGAGLGEGIE